MGMTIIKGYGMPHNCYDCDLHNYHECDLTAESIEEDYCWNGDSREKHCPLREVEAIPKAQYDELKANITMMRLDYEARLKADMVAMLEEIDARLTKLQTMCNQDDLKDKKMHFAFGVSRDVIREKINVLKAESEDQE